LAEARCRAGGWSAIRTLGVPGTKRRDLVLNGDLRPCSDEKRPCCWRKISLLFAINLPVPKARNWQLSAYRRWRAAAVTGRFQRDWRAVSRNKSLVFQSLEYFLFSGCIVCDILIFRKQR
jgi:hypothetical protein